MQSKKLYWLEYTDWGPLVLTRPFEAVGFETQENGWDPAGPAGLMERIFPELESWQPDVLVFWMSKGYLAQFNREPDEWITACRRIRAHSNLQRTKIMALFSFEKITAEQEAVWGQRYDFYSLCPIRVVEHAKIAKRLAGEKVKGFEGVNYALLRNGSWTLQDYLLSDQVTKDISHPDAIGQFAKAPETRLLTEGGQGKHNWIVGGIQAETLTYIVYIVKNEQSWQAGLNTSEIAYLVALAENAASGYQLFVGASDALLRINPAVADQVIRQVQQAGGWQIFINEHLWFEGIIGYGVRQVLYEGRSSLGPVTL